MHKTVISPGAWWRWLCLALACLAGSAWADAPGRVGRLAEVHGTVWLFDVETGEWVHAHRNRPLTSGDRLATERQARAELRIGSTTVRLDESTDLELQRVDDDRMELRLFSGSVAARLRSRDTAREFELRSAVGRFQPLRAGHYRVDAGERLSAAGVWSGELRFDSNDSTLVLRSGQRGEFWQQHGVTHYTWATMPGDDFERWVVADDRRDEQLAATRYVSPEMTGWEDLDAHGRWDRHPEYGTVWVPMHVSSGWAPYRYGQWVWRRPWGWTWVDDAPWGFAPFHYGRWAWWGGRWCWVPGAYVARPAFAPALVGWVGGSGVSVSVRIGGGPLVGWVPLAPYEVYQPGYRVRPDYWERVNPYPRPRPGREPIMYGNQGVPNGVTLVPADALKLRQPIASAAERVDGRAGRELIQQVRPIDGPPAAVQPVVTASPRPVPAALPPGVMRIPRSAGLADRDPGSEGGRPGVRVEAAPAAGHPLGAGRSEGRDDGRPPAGRTAVAPVQAAEPVARPGPSVHAPGWERESTPAIGGGQWEQERPGVRVHDERAPRPRPEPGLSGRPAAAPPAVAPSAQVAPPSPQPSMRPALPTPGPVMVTPSRRADDERRGEPQPEEGRRQRPADPEGGRRPGGPPRSQVY